MELFLLFGMPLVDGRQATIESVYYDLQRATLAKPTCRERLRLLRPSPAHPRRPQTRRRADGKSTG